MSRMRMTALDYAGAVGFFVYASSVVVTPVVLLQLASELSFGLAEGGGIEAIRAGFLLAILLASGAAALRWGKIPTLAAGGAVLALGLLAYALSPSYAVVLASIVFVGLGGGILEALINPLIQDEHPTDSGRYLNFVNAFFSVGVLVSVLIVGDLLTRGVSWRLLVTGIAGLSALSTVLFLVAGRRSGPQHAAARARRVASPAPEGTAPADAAPADADGLWGSARRVLREPLFWVFAVAMFCGGGAEGAFTFWSASYIQIHFETVARAGAFGTAAFAAGMVAGRMGFGRFVAQRGLRRLIIVSAVAGVAVSIAAYLSENMFTLFGVLFAAGLSIACFWPSIQSHAAARLGHDSTTLFILLSCAGIPGFGLTSWFMGLVAEQYGLRSSLLVIPALLTILAATMLVSRRVGSATESQ